MDIYLAINGEQAGPFPTDVVRKKWADGEINADTLMWKDGMADWEPVSQHLSPATSQNPVPLPGLQMPAPAAPNPATTATYAPGSILPTTAVTEDWTLANRLPRLGAALLDGVFTLICIAPGLIALMLTGAVATDNPTGAIIAGILIFFGSLAALGVQIFLLATKSQSLGKMLLRLRIYNVQTRAPADWVKTIILRAFVNGLIGGVPYIGALYGLVDVGFIFRQDRRCIHDLIAGTVVGKY
ncbi:MAG: RDD family protein [Bdellovibrionaceae bacterium]|nr:RDD family protein [Pseudobdellovibrionaceae bacterium]